MSEETIDLLDADTFTQDHVTLEYIKVFLKKLISKRKKLYIKYLSDNFDDHRLSNEDMNEFALYLAPEREKMKKVEWVESFKLIPLQRQYQLMESLENMFYSSLPTESITKTSPYKNAYFEGNIIHTDVFYLATTNIRKYKLPYVTGISLCLNSPQIGNFPTTGQPQTGSTKNVSLDLKNAEMEIMREDLNDGKTCCTALHYIHS
ncbi:hypothetical protein HELRODRAFT_182952 [Helobdella robusta]|uniref:Uncharacterized protein n=1 Tax=Helobdella robusta TaxID=6412 RepID=T1FIZ2_HELRO|nr:hypothetical protein HELRODRAFT_182952 [Helobdella robusta]ESN89942.1 hypothetical protein HELRODRAFT_182952 [Helobdella robusta]